MSKKFYKVSELDLELIINVIANGINKNYSWLELNNLLNNLKKCEKIELKSESSEISKKNKEK